MTTTTFDPGKLQTPVTILYDGTNAASVHEAKFLKTKEAVSEQLYARDASGAVFDGSDALYAAHTAIGLANWFAMCRLPGFLCVGTGIGPKH